jgi:hypothetical protein
LTRCIFTLLIVAVLSGCARNNEFRFERLDGEQSSPTAFKFDGVSGTRDGSSVWAEMRFSDGLNRVQMNVLIALVPPAQFKSGVYQMTVDGKTMDGSVECTSLDYLGGQAAQPSVGGVFILKDAQSRPAFRVTIPTTILTRKPAVKL